MPTEISVAAIVLDSVGLGLGIFALWVWPGGRGKAPSFRRDLCILITLGLLLMLASLGLGKLMLHSGFATLRFFCHALFCVLAPLCMLRGISYLRRSLLLGLLGLGLGLGMEAVYLYALHIEPQNLQVNHYAVRTDRLNGCAPLRLLVMADLQTDQIGAYERKVFAKVDQLKPDLILMPGDYLQIWDKEKGESVRQQLLQCFKQLKHQPKYGIYAADGDVDYAHRTFRDSKVVPLKDRVQQLPAETRLQILGLSTPASRMPLRQARLKPARDFPGFTIIMGHAPDYAMPLIRNGATMPLLCIAGHTHGGQIRIPGFGPLLTLSRVPRKYASGFHQLGQGWLLVSRGIGHERGYAPRIRLFCPPELVMITLQGQEP